MKNIHILSFDSFSKPLLENVETAKNFLYKIAKYKKANPKKEIKSLEQLKGFDLRGIELDSKEKEEALGEFRFEGGNLKGKPIFATVKEFLEKKNSPSYTYPFVYFALEMPTLEIGLSDSELDKKIKEIENSDKKERQKELEIENLTKNLDFSNLLRKLAQQKQIKDRFPLPYVDPDGYIRAKEQGDIKRMPAIEKLNDDLDEKLREMKVDQFFGNHAPIIKDYFRKEILKKKNESPAMKELYDEVFNTIWPILRLEQKEGEPIRVFARDRHGNRTEEVLREYPNRAENVLLSQSGMYKDTKNYPEISDKSKPEVAFRHFLDNAKGVEKGWAKSVHQTINDLENQSPAVKILHIFTKDNILLTSARTWYGMSEVCRITSSAFCIEQQAQWNSYTTGRLQISINQMELDQNSSKALLSYTINPDLTVHDYGDKNNKHPLLQANKQLSWYLEKEGVPNREEIVDIIRKNVTTELAIKKLLDTIYKEIGGSKKGGTVLSFLGATWIQTRIKKEEISQKEWNKMFGIVAGAIKKEFKFTTREVESYFEEKGFSTIQDFLIYQDFMGSDFNWADAEKIYQTSIEAIELLNDVQGFGDEVDKTLSAILKEFHKVEEVFRTRIIPEIGEME